MIKQYYIDKLVSRNNNMLFQIYLFGLKYVKIYLFLSLTLVQRLETMFPQIYMYFQKSQQSHADLFEPTTFT